MEIRSFVKIEIVSAFLTVMFMIPMQNKRVIGEDRKILRSTFRQLYLFSSSIWFGEA